MNTIDWAIWERPTSYVLAEDLQLGRYYVLKDSAIMIVALHYPKRRNGKTIRIEVEAVTPEGVSVETQLFPSDLVAELPSASAQYRIDWINHDIENERRELWLKLVEGPSQKSGMMYIDDAEYALVTEILTCWDARNCDTALERLPPKNLRMVEDRVVEEWEEYDVVVTLTDIHTVEGSSVSDVVVCWCPRV